MNVCNHPRKRKRASHCKSVGNVARKATKKNRQRTFANVFSCVRTFARLRLDKGYFSKVLCGLKSVREAVASCEQFAISVAKCVMLFIVFCAYFFRFCFTVILQSFGVTGVVMQTIAHDLQLAGTSPHLGKIRCNNKKHVWHNVMFVKFCSEWLLLRYVRPRIGGAKVKRCEKLCNNLALFLHHNRAKKFSKSLALEYLRMKFLFIRFFDITSSLLRKGITRNSNFYRFTIRH